MIVIGVDPGLTGALSLIDSARGLLGCEDIPTESNGTASGSMKRWVDVRALDLILKDWSARYEFARESVHVCIERPIPMPSMPVSTTASSFDTFGVLRAMLEVRCATGTPVSPREWKSFFGLGTDKNASRECCMRLYPGAPVSRVKDHNRAESILIGHFLLRKLA